MDKATEDRWAAEPLRPMPAIDLPIIEEPPDGSGYREADDEGGSACGNCRHFALGGECVLWLAYVDEDHLCDSYEGVSSSVDSTLSEIALNDLKEYPDYVALLSEDSTEEDFWEAYQKLDDEHSTDLNLAIRKWIPNKQPRWPKGAPGGLGGQFMEVADILARTDKEPVVDISPLASGARNIGKVQLSRIRNPVRNRVDGASLKKTTNPNVLLLSVRMKAGEAFADTSFYISKKALGIEMIQTLLQRLNAGAQLKQLITPNIKMLASSKYYNPYRVISRIIRGQASGIVPLSEEGGEEIMEFGELFFSEGTIVEEDGILWKSTLPVGELAMTPDYMGRPVHKPLRVIEGHSDNPHQAVGLADLIEAFEEEVVQHVTIPTSHADKVTENTGFVKKVKIEEDPKLKVKSLWVGMDVKDPNVKEMMKDGRIANVSAGIAFDHYRKTDGKKYPAVLKHVALTNHPWVPGMLPFGEGNFSEDSEIIPLIALASVDHWDETRSIWARRDALTDALEAQPGVELELLDFDGSEALIRNNDKNQIMVIPYTRRGDSTAFHWAAAKPVQGDDYKLNPEDRAEAAREALGIAASEEGGDGNSDAQGGETNMSELTEQERQELEELRRERDELRATSAAAEAKSRVADVDARINTLKEELGLSEQPGFLRVVRELLLADVVKDTGVNLSEDHAGVETTITQVVESLIAALPRDAKGKLQLSEQQDGDAAGDPPAVNESEVKSVEDRAREAREFLMLPTGRV